jgi:hypothetical protein
MCQFQNCNTKTKPYGFCIICGKEICPDCASTSNIKKHSICSLENFIKGNFPLNNYGHGIPRDDPGVPL